MKYYQLILAFISSTAAIPMRHSGHSQSESNDQVSNSFLASSVDEMQSPPPANDSSYNQQSNPGFGLDLQMYDPQQYPSLLGNPLFYPYPSHPSTSHQVSNPEQWDLFQSIPSANQMHRHPGLAFETLPSNHPPQESSSRNQGMDVSRRANDLPTSGQHRSEETASEDMVEYSCPTGRCGTLPIFDDLTCHGCGKKYRRRSELKAHALDRVRRRRECTRQMCAGQSAALFARKKRSDAGTKRIGSLRQHHSE